MKSEVALQLALIERQYTCFLEPHTFIPPQLHVKVALGWQYAALAKYVHGVKILIWAVERGVMPCLGSRGAPWTGKTLARIAKTRSNIFAIVIAPDLKSGPQRLRS